jgi:hypothetical protein
LHLAIADIITVALPIIIAALDIPILTAPAILFAELGIIRRRMGISIVMVVA